MKDRNGKNQPKDKGQLELFNAQQASPVTPDSSQLSSKVISLADHKNQQDIRKFYDAASKATSHLK